MARPKASQPTELELEILEVLWRRGPSTARQLHQTLPSSRKLSISSVHIAVRSMAAKGYLREERRKKSEGGLLYSPLLSRQSRWQHARIHRSKNLRRHDQAGAAAVIERLKISARRIWTTSAKSSARRSEVRADEWSAH